MVDESQYALLAIVILLLSCFGIIFAIGWMMGSYHMQNKWLQWAEQNKKTQPMETSLLLKRIEELANWQILMRDVGVKYFMGDSSYYYNILHMLDLEPIEGADNGD